MGDQKKTQPGEQPGKSAIILARDFKKVGDQGQAKKFALQEIESLKKGKRHNDIIQIAKEFALPKKITDEGASSLFEKMVEDGEYDQALKIVEKYKLNPTLAYGPALHIFNQRINENNLVEAARIKLTYKIKKEDYLEQILIIVKRSIWSISTTIILQKRNMTVQQYSRLILKWTKKNCMKLQISLLY